VAPLAACVSRWAIAAALQLHGVARDSLLTGAAKKNHDGYSLCMDTG
jgi:hypothetical protein